jgi:hypothetical protein
VTLLPLPVLLHASFDGPRMKIGPIEFKLGRVYEALLGDQVISGPFKDMRYGAGAVGSQWGPKILGTYEKELADIVEAICRTDYDLLVNPGAAEGYYPTGLARRMPQLRAIVFEGNEEGRRLLERNAQRNGVAGRMDIRGFCQPGDLEAALQGARRPLVLLDIEGGEMQMCDPARVPGLRRADVLVELHEFASPGCGAAIQARFSSTHRIQEVKARSRSLEEMPSCALAWLARLTPHRGLRWMDERRNYAMSWLWMTRREGPGNVE